MNPLASLSWSLVLFGPAATDPPDIAPALQPEQRVEAPAEESDDVVPISLMLFPTVGTDDGLRDERVMKNLSIALVAGYAWKVHGADLSFGLAWTERELQGVQLGNAALVEGALEGMQLASFIAFTGQSTRGVQWAGFATWADGRAEGFQAAGIFNYAGGTVQGMQLAGLINIAGEAQGIQLAPINLAGVADGAQVGVINIGYRSSGLTLGLLNLIADGLHEVSLYSSDIAVTNVALILGGSYTYTVFTAGAGPFEDMSGWVVGVGVGARAPLGDFYLDVSGIARAVRTDFSDGFEARTTGRLFTVQLIGGYQVLEQAKIFIGPTINFYHTERERRMDQFIPARALASGDDNLYFWPGFVFGMEI